jgi:vesicle transport through interaction with t-SNAREs protein 1
MNHANLLLSQTKELLKQMTIEARSVQDPDLKEDCLQTVRVAKGNQANLVQDVKAAQQLVDRVSLLPQNASSSHDGSGGGTHDLEAGTRHKPKNDPARQHLLHTNHALGQQNQTLEHARRVMAETEDVALEITEELGRNRETIQSARSRVMGVTTLTNRARRILVSMQRREVQQKMVVYGVGVVLFLLVLFMLGFI